MLDLILAFLASTRALSRNRADNALEILALRQQLAVLKMKRFRPHLNLLDRLFWSALRKVWSRWRDALLIVKPETVIGWRRVGYRLYWRWRSRPSGGRSKTSAEIRELIHRMATENPSWGAPRIHGELQKLGFAVSERSVARYLRQIRRRGDPAKRWLTFLRNRREAIVALDFFTVPTWSFREIYALVVIEHGRRRILHFNVTRHPTAEWVLQQLRECFPEAAPYRYVILDHDAKLDVKVAGFLKSTELKVKRTSIQSPWQNGLCERWIGSCRREMLDHVIALSEQHLRRLLREYIAYYHQDRLHDALGKNAPQSRVVERRPSPSSFVTSNERVGGLHHRYDWREAA